MGYLELEKSKAKMLATVSRPTLHVEITTDDGAETVRHTECVLLLARLFPLFH